MRQSMTLQNNQSVRTINTLSNCFIAMEIPIKVSAAQAEYDWSVGIPTFHRCHVDGRLASMDRYRHVTGLRNY